MTGRHARRRRRVRGSSVAAVACAVIVVGVAADAQAFWLAGGTGTGTAPTGTAAAVTLTPGEPDELLHPGGRSAVDAVATNSNDSAVSFASLTLDVSQGTDGFAVDAQHAGCAVTSLDFTAQTNAGAGWQVPARVGTTTGTLAISLPNAVGMSVTAANACQGAQFTVYLTAGP